MPAATVLRGGEKGPDPLVAPPATSRVRSARGALTNPAADRPLAELLEVRVFEAEGNLAGACTRVARTGSDLVRIRPLA